MASAKLTLIGMYNYDSTLFDGMILPSDIDKNTLVNSLLLKGGEFETLYADIPFMKFAINTWSDKWKRTFAEWVRGTQATWNPIHNYDRYEDSKDDRLKEYNSTDNIDVSDTRASDAQDINIFNHKDISDINNEVTNILNTKDTQNKNLQDESVFNNQDTNSQIKESTTEHQVSAYDSSAYQPSSKDIINNGESKTAHTGTVTNTNTGTETTAHSGTDVTSTNGSDKATHSGSDHSTSSEKDEMLRKGKMSDLTGQETNTDTHTAHLYGNIGVTTSASMLSEFYEISKWNLYDHISDVFISELLIPVY